jgi:hypothetical protein
MPVPDYWLGNVKGQMCLSVCLCVFCLVVVYLKMLLMPYVTSRQENMFVFTIMSSLALQLIAK